MLQIGTMINKPACQQTVGEKNRLKGPECFLSNGWVKLGEHGHGLVRPEENAGRPFPSEWAATAGEFHCSVSTSRLQCGHNLL